MVDIKSYDIKLELKEQGSIKAVCKINYDLLNENNKMIYLQTSPQIEIVSVKDSNGDPLVYLNKKGEPGFSIIWDDDQPTTTNNTIEVTYKGEPFLGMWGIHFSVKSQPWFSQNIIDDAAKYDISFEYPSEFKMLIENKRFDGDENKCEFISGKELTDISVCVGNLNKGSGNAGSKFAFNIYIPCTPDWSASGFGRGIVQSIIGLASDMVWFDNVMGEVGSDLLFFHNLLGFSPFDTLSLVEFPFSKDIGKPGLVYLSTERGDSGLDFRYRNLLTRGHESAHQWWGNVVKVESEKDRWILEGLAVYCAYLSLQEGSIKPGEKDSMLVVWKDEAIIPNSNSGPITLGRRLESGSLRQDSDYFLAKSAYIFHMIRYYLWDNHSNSDSNFIEFLKDIIDSYKWQTITTENLKSLLEKHTGEDMTWFFDQWVYGTEIPSLSFSYKSAKTSDNTYKITCTVKQDSIQSDFISLIPVTVLFDDESISHHKLLIDGPNVMVSLPFVPSKPLKVIFNTYDAVLTR